MQCIPSDLHNNIENNYFGKSGSKLRSISFIFDRMKYSSGVYFAGLTVQPKAAKPYLKTIRMLIANENII